MKTNTKRIGMQWTALLASAIFTICASRAFAQGTITFNEPWVYYGQVSYDNYYDKSMWFRVAAAIPQTPYHVINRLGSTISLNGTPFIRFSRYNDRTDYVVFSQINNSAFGLISVDLSDYYSPSYTPVPITFNGYKYDGTMVTQTFTTAGGGTSSFQTFSFNSSFASGLSRVEIPSSIWAMDNLVFVPEPCTGTLLGLGLVVFVMRSRKPIQN